MSPAETVEMSFAGRWHVDEIEGGLLVDLPEVGRLLSTSVDRVVGWTVVDPHITIYGRSHKVGRAIRRQGPALAALA